MLNLIWSYLYDPWSGNEVAPFVTPSRESIQPGAEIHALVLPTNSRVVQPPPDNRACHGNTRDKDVPRKVAQGHVLHVERAVHQTAPLQSGTTVTLRCLDDASVQTHERPAVDDVGGSQDVAVVRGGLLQRFWTLDAVDKIPPKSHPSTVTVSRGQGRTGRLDLARWAGWSAGQVGRHVKC